MSLSYLPGFRRESGSATKAQSCEKDRLSGQRNREQEISRLLSAALVNQRFAALLLDHPGRALAEGYQGSRFGFSAADSQAIALIRAASIQEFAIELVRLCRPRE